MSAIAEQPNGRSARHATSISNPIARQTNGCSARQYPVTNHQIMQKSVYYNLTLLLWGLALVVLSCDSNAQQKQNPEDVILRVNKELLDSNQHIIKANAREYIRLTQEFIASKADSMKIIKYAIQGAEVAVNIEEYEQAIQSYDLIALQFPSNPKVVANALFAKAFTFENYLKDTDTARKIYQSILDKYPNQEIAKMVRPTLENLGKSEAQLLEMIKNKNK